MTVLYCQDGSKKGVDCTYSLTYKNTPLSETAEQASWKYGTKGYDCPWCHKFPLKVKQIKSELRLLDVLVP